MFWKLYLQAAESVSWVNTLVLLPHDLSLVSECDRVSSPVLFQQLSNHPFRLFFPVLADTHSSQRWEVISDFLTPATWPRAVSCPLGCIPQFREDAGGFQVLFWFNSCTYAALLLWVNIVLASFKVYEKDVIISSMTQGNKHCYLCCRKKKKIHPMNVIISSRWPDLLYCMVSAQCCHTWKLKRHDNSKHFLNMTEKQGPCLHITQGIHKVWKMYN